jgi:hypothetical protein
MAIAALINESAVKADQNYTSIYRVVNTHSPKKKHKKCLFYGKNRPSHFLRPSPDRRNNVFGYILSNYSLAWFFIYI